MWRTLSLITVFALGGCAALPNYSAQNSSLIIIDGCAVMAENLKLESINEVQEKWVFDDDCKLVVEGLKKDGNQQEHKTDD